MNTGIIKHVTISKLWGIKTISTDFDEHINIFIGINGSSKTTFLNLIEATFLVDLKVFYSIDFEHVKIDLIDSSIQSITVMKFEKAGDVFIRYSFDYEEPIEIPCSEIILQRPYRLPIIYREGLNQIKEKMNNIINISWLSVNRDNSDYEDYNRHSSERFSNMVDMKLQELIKKLLVFHLQLESDANKDSLKFKEEVLSLMLYNSKFDNYNENNLKLFESTDIESMRRDLYKAFNKLGVAKDKSGIIQNHINKIQESISRISNSDRISFEDVFVLSLINRTVSIVDISKEHEMNTANIYAPLTHFWKCLKSFMPNKNFQLNADNQRDLYIELLEGSEQKQEIPITSLSSGEKQLFILLSEALLQNKTSQLFIADEPELSLHIDWQRKILNALLDLNPKAQIIVATHSPEIAGNFPQNIINMKNITIYESFK
jgi:predicted ATP-dependent endonuclease of OLD family